MQRILLLHKRPTNIVISETIENLMLQYHPGIRNIIIPKPAVKNHCFPTRAGSGFLKITETIPKVVKKYNIPIPTPCPHQKVNDTAGQSTLDDRDMRSLSSHMAILQQPMQDSTNSQVLSQ